MSDSIVNIDGSILEGGGQIIRNALSLSALTGRPIKITNIRAGREKPGLMEQHLKGLELMQDITKAAVRGGNKGSTTIEFCPERIHPGNFKSLIQTAGSISLILQVALPCCIFAPDSVYLSLTGATNAELAPQIDFMTEVFRPNLEKMGATFDLDLQKRGYFPRGGGSVHIHIQPLQELQPIIMENMGEVTALYGWSFSAGRSNIQEATEMAQAAEMVLKPFNTKVDIEVYHETKHIAPIGDCAGIILVAETSTGCILGGSAIKKRMGNPQQAGISAAEELANTLKAKVCVDDHTQDQLIIFMALAKGKSRVKVANVTLHTKTAIHVAELMTSARFKIEDYSTHSIIECDGIGYQRRPT